MKKYLFLFVSILALIIACSKEDESAPPPTPKFTVSFSAGEGGSVSTSGGTYDKGTKVSVTATPDGEFVFDKWSDGNTDNPREITISSNLSLSASFVKKKYALSVTVEGEGTVEEEVIVQGSTSSTEYNSGTTVKLTATPSDEWVFSGWSGDIESTDNPIEVTVSEAKSITATFDKLNFIVNLIPINNYPDNTWFSSESVHYEYNGEEYILSGGVYWDDPNHYRPPLVLLKRNEYSWEVIKVFNNIEISEIRNSEFSIDGKYLLISDHGPEWPDIEWPFSHLYIGEIVDGNIIWNKISENPSFYHDASIGDIDGDGIFDIVGGHLGTRNNNLDNPHVYFGEVNNKFKEQKNILPDAPEGGCCGDIEVYDLNNNGLNEIIRIGGYWEREIIDAVEFNSTKDEFEIIFSLDEIIPENPITGTYSEININGYNSGFRGFMPRNNRFKDFNGDGNMDFINEKDGLTIWLGDGNMNFSPFRLNLQGTENNDYYLMSGQRFFDIENDGDVDIVTKVSNLGDPQRDDGIRLYNIIYINDNGQFKRLSNSEYFISNEEVYSSYYGMALIPFLRQGRLSFFGKQGDNMVEIITNIPASYWYD